MKANTRHARFLRSTHLALAIAAATLAGCDERSDLEVAISEASTTMTSINGGGRAIPDADVRTAKYDSIVQTLKAKLNNGSDAEKAAANALLAQAYAGQAGVAAEQAADIDSDIMQRIAVGGQLLAEYDEYAAQARALRTYGAARGGPSARDRDIQTLDQRIQERADELEALDRELNETLAKIAQHEALAASEQALSREDRQRERDIRAQTIDKSARESAVLITRADEFRAAADKHDVASQLAELEASRFRPVAEALELKKSQTRRQIEQLREAQQAARDRAEILNSRADDQANLANERASDLAELVEQIESLRADQLQPAFDNAISKYESAASTLNASARSLSGNTGVSVAGMRLSLADTRDRLAASLNRIADFYERIDQGLERTPDALRLDEVRDAATSASAEADEAWNNARNALQSARARGEVSEQLERVANRIPAAPPAGDAPLDDSESDQP